MTVRKGVSIYVPQAMLEEHGEQIITQPAAKGYLSAGFILTLTLDPRSYLLLAKPHDSKLVRLWIYKSDLLLLKAYSHFEKIGQPDLYWTTIYQAGFKAMEENILIDGGIEALQQEVVAKSSYVAAQPTAPAMRTDIEKVRETEKPVPAKTNSATPQEKISSSNTSKNNDLSSLTSKTRPIRLRR